MELDFIEFNVPKVLEQYIPNRTKGKNILEYTLKKGTIRIVGRFDPKKIQKKVEKDMLTEYMKQLKAEKSMYREMKHAVLKAKKKQGKKSS